MAARVVSLKGFWITTIYGCLLIALIDSLLPHGGSHFRNEQVHDIAARALEEDTMPAECNCPSANPLSSVPLAIQIIMIILLISLSALFSGLTLGLMGLDKTGLEIIMDGGDEKSAQLATIIYPVRENGNLLLCTLLLGNTAVNALLSILLADKAGGILGFLASTFIILIFGEIVPKLPAVATLSRLAARRFPSSRSSCLSFTPPPNPWHGP